MADSGKGKDLSGKRDRSGSKDEDGSSGRQHQPLARPSESDNDDGRARHSQYREVAQATLQDPSDGEVQEAYRRRYLQLDPRDRPSREVILDRAAHLMSILRDRSSPRASILLLANAGWDQNAALQHFTQSRRQQAQRLEEQASEGRSRNLPERPASRMPESGVTSLPVVEQRRAPRSYGKDDDLPFPKGIETLEGDDPMHPGRKIRAVFHHQIRRYLIERDTRLYGAYKYPHNGHPFTRKVPFEDQTAPHPDQIGWCFTKGKDYLPGILLQWQRAGRPDPPYDIRPMYWRRHLVLDTDRNPILDFWHIPSTLASNAEGGLLEALERLDSRCRHQDLAARQYGRTPLMWPTLKDLKNHDNKLAQQMRRFRERTSSIPWSDKRSGSEAFVQWVENNLSEGQKAANTTRGLLSPSESRFSKLKLNNAGKNPERARDKKDAAKNTIYLNGIRRRVEKAEAKEIEKYGRVMEFTPVKDTLHEDDDMPDQDPGSEPSDDESADIYDYDDPRGREAKTEEEIEAWHEAMQPTIDDYCRQTGNPPRNLSKWNTTYWAIYLHYQRKLITDLGLSTQYWSNVPRDAPFTLVGLARWEGGILDWHKARRINNPNATPVRM
ncbi:MAG: hypothetical protein Q9202_000556 [Teloschistes flavicans]